MYGDVDICEDCSNEYGVCKRCGKKLTLEDSTSIKLRVLYDSENATIDLLKNSAGLESIRISYFQDGHWAGESWIDNVLSQKDANFRKIF